MRITITPTQHITRVNRDEARVWDGVTDQGVACKVFVTRIAVAEGDDAGQFEETLRSELPPGVAIDLRYIL